jgi:hypothetical protein
MHEMKPHTTQELDSSAGRRSSRCHRAARVLLALGGGNVRAPARGGGGLEVESTRGAEHARRKVCVLRRDARPPEAHVNEVPAGQHAGSGVRVQ